MEGRKKPSTPSKNQGFHESESLLFLGIYDTFTTIHHHFQKKEAPARLQMPLYNPYITFSIFLISFFSRS